MLKLLARAKGATIAEIAAPNGWQPHSARAYLSGLRKKGLTVAREQRKSGETTYRVVDAASANVKTALPLAGDPPISAVRDHAASHDTDSDTTGSAALDHAGADTGTGAEPPACHPPGYGLRSCSLP